MHPNRTRTSGRARAAAWARLAAAAIAAIAAAALAPAPAAAQPVRVCDDGAEWPPYVFYPTKDGAVDRARLDGVAPELFKKITELTGLEFQYELIPWRRCQDEVLAFGKGGQYEMFMNGSVSTERQTKYLGTVPLYANRQGVFYRVADYPDGPPLESPSDFAGKRLCGILGYNYEMWVRAGLATQIDTGTKDVPQVMNKLVLKRCDFYLTNMETVQGAIALGSLKLPPGLASKATPLVPLVPFHAWVSRSSPRAESLLKAFDGAVATLRASGEYEALYRKYLPDGSALE